MELCLFGTLDVRIARPFFSKEFQDPCGEKAHRAVAAILSSCWKRQRTARDHLS